MFKGLIIRNGLAPNSSWSKRVNHWRESFNNYNIETEIFSVYPTSISKSKNSIFSRKYRKISRSNYFRYFMSPFVLITKLRKFRPDFILLANGGFWEFFTIPIYCKIRRIPFLVDMVDTIGRKYKSKKNLFDYLIIFNKLLFDYLIVRNSHEIFVISSSLENHYKSLFPEKKVTRSVPSTVNIEQFIRSAAQPISVLNNDIYSIFDDKTVFKVFYAGTITRMNGVNFFLEALSSVLNEIRKEIVVIFAVIEGNIEDLKESLLRFNIYDKAIIVPPVDQEKLPMLLSRSDILFLPEQGIEVANSGFPGKTSEYLMSGNPVITTNFSDLGYYLEDQLNSCITPIGDMESYKANLKKLILEDEFRISIGNQGKELAMKEFSYKSCAALYIESVKSYYNTFRKGKDENSH